jgi:predicted Na+-dependent transporter
VGIHIRKVLTFSITIILLLLVNKFISNFFDIKFIDLSVLVGVLGISLIFFFTSSGGYFSNNLNLQTQARTGIKMEEEQRSFTASSAFYASIFYFLVSLIITLVVYRSYF